MLFVSRRSSLFRLSVVSVVLVFMLASTGMFAAPGSSQVPPLPRPEELQVRRLYQAVLDREPDDAGLAYWVALLSTGTPLELITQGFVDSDEFRVRFRVTPGPEGNAPFVEALYENVLDRPAEAAGFKYWMSILESGAARYRVVLAFSESQEFIRKTGLGLTELPPFFSGVETVTAADLGSSWRPGCPVAPEGLRLLNVSHVNFDGGVQNGQLVINTADVDDFIRVFETLYEARYPVEQMIPVQHYESDDILSMEANNTSAFNCRAVTGGTGWSRHAYGVALDINPMINPYVTSTMVLPENGAPFVDRTTFHPALIREGDVMVRAFDAIGWRWGGRWNSLKDWHHFDRRP